MDGHDVYYHGLLGWVNYIVEARSYSFEMTASQDQPNVAVTVGVPVGKKEALQR